jgi:hypothetical protein
LTPSTRLVNPARLVDLRLRATVNPVNPLSGDAVILVLLGLAVLLVALAAYRVRCALQPFDRKGRRRGWYWLRTWWSGGQAENRDPQ